MDIIIKRICALSLFLSFVLAFAGCAEKAPEQPAPVDIYRSTLVLWETLPQEQRDEFFELHRQYYQKYMERLTPLSDLIFAQLLQSDLSGDLRLRSVADDFAKAFLDSAWSANLPDALVVSVRIVEHPNQELATEGQRAKYDKLAIEFTDASENCYMLCFEDWTAILYQDGEILENHYTKIIY